MVRNKAIYLAMGNVMADWWRAANNWKAAMNQFAIVRAERPLEGERDAPMVIKSGSYLCSADFCLRYRPSSRQPQDPRFASYISVFVPCTALA